MATKSANPAGMSLGAASIGPAAWRNNTTKEIKLANSVVKMSDRACAIGRTSDPLPHLREVVAELSNDEAHRYFREVREIANMLRDSLIDTNSEIKLLTRGREALEKALENVRKDIKLNHESQEIRSTRPQREKEEDGADGLLQAERLALLNMKRQLETQLQLTQQQLLTLDAARRRLAAAVQERSRVLDLICQALPATTGRNTARTYRTTWGSGRGSRMCASADGYTRSGMPNVDPLGMYTPEADEALKEAKEARDRSAMLRNDLENSIARVDQQQRNTHKSVNNGITQKMAETVNLKQQLDLASGHSRHAIHRAQRWYDTTEKVWGYSRGPVTSSDLTTREKLNRPIVRVFQRHPGTNVPEAQEIVKGGNGLLDSLHNTSRNIGALKLAQLKLKEDIRDKKAALDVDGAIVRLRRRKGNHRWVMGEAF